MLLRKEYDINSSSLIELYLYLVSWIYVDRVEMIFDIANNVDSLRNSPASSVNGLD